jgi:hypothetical protein
MDERPSVFGSEVPDPTEVDMNPKTLALIQGLLYMLGEALNVALPAKEGEPSVGGVVIVGVSVIYAVTIWVKTNVIDKKVEEAAHTSDGLPTP